MWERAEAEGQFKQLEILGADNQRHQPIMVHRALFGSVERFFGVLLEHFAGAFPVWLSPEQVRVLPVSDAQAPAAHAVAAQLKAVGLRVMVDDGNDTLNYRIREGEMAKVPYMAVVGQREADGGTVALRIRGAGKKQEIVPVAAFVARVAEEVGTRALVP